MTETRTTRFNLARWSAGTDSPSRTDFDGSFGELEARAAYDDGVSASTLPVTNVVAGRYAWQAQGSSPVYRTLWRRDDASTWWPVGGPTIPTTQLIRALVDPPLSDATKDGLRIEHPSLDQGGWASNLTFDGMGALRRGVALGHPSDSSLGRLTVGGTALPASTVRAQITGYAANEHVLLLKQAYTGGGTPGSLLRGINGAGSVVLDLDGAGRLLASQAAAFGGASLPTSSMLAVAPSAAGADTNGLLLYGQASATAKTILRVQPDAGDTASILTAARTSINVGRIPWGSPGSTGTVTSHANTHHLRVSSHASNTIWTAWWYTDLTAESDLSKDTWYFLSGPGGWQFRLPGYHSQELIPAQPTMTLYRFLNFSNPFLLLATAVRSGASVTYTTAGSWEADGRIQSGAPWRGAGTLRDARQGIRHVSHKAWAVSGDPANAGQLVPSASSTSYTFPVMTLRSLTATDLSVEVLTELLLSQGGALDAQVYSVRLEVAINGGAFAAVEMGRKVETAAITPPNSVRAAGDLFTSVFTIPTVGAGSTVQIRATFAVGASSSPGVYLRSMELNVREEIVEVYAAA